MTDVRKEADRARKAIKTGNAERFYSNIVFITNIYKRNEAESI